MSTLCHSCGNSIPEHSAYCPECGAPQLRVQTTEQREAEQSESSVATPLPGHAGDIVWPVALRSAALFAIPAGLMVALRENPGFLDMIWIVLGAVWTLRFYRRRVPGAPVLSPRMGGRIGLLLGLFASIVAVAAQAARLLIERYGLHHGSVIDARLKSYAQLEIDLINASNPDAVKEFAWLAHFWLSPEGKGVLLLLTVVSATVSILFFAWLTGRFSIRYGAARPRKR